MKVIFRDTFPLPSFGLLLAVLGSFQREKIVFAQRSDIPISDFGSLFDGDENSKNVFNEQNKAVCDTKECQIIANEFLRGMNTSVEPCENLYDFVCGAWEMQNQIPKYEPMWSRFHIFQDTVNRRIRDILEEEPKSADILPLRQAKKWYRSCLDIGTLEQRGIKPMEAILLQVGGWPMTLDPQEWNEKEHSWQSVEHDYFHITGGYVFYDVSKVQEDEFGILFEKGSIPLYSKLPPKYRNYTGDDYEVYVELITEVTRMFVKYNKAAVTYEMIEKDVQDLVEFEKQIHLLARSIEEYDYDILTIAGFVQWYNGNMSELGFNDETQKIDFENLIRRKFDLVNREIQDSDMLIVDSHFYYVQLTELLNQTTTRTIVNYIHWHFVSDMLVYTTEATRDAFFKFMKNEFDIKERPPRWLECIDEMKMKSAAAYAFVQKYFSQEVEEAAQEMIENVRQGMIEQIDESNWMDEDTKKMVTEKLEAMTVYVGFPDWYKNESSVLNSYKGLTIGYDHFDNILSFKKYEIKKSLQRTLDMSYKPDLLSWIDPTAVNAFYSPWDNAAVLPAALFQSPLFTSRVPSSINYGLIGIAAGHEMGHGFDSGSIRLGRDGNKTEISTEMLEIYDERAECFVEQFNEYYGTTENPDSDEISRGRKTRPDNIADSTGLHSVFRAFRKLHALHSITDYHLPGFDNFTHDQMFFISYAAMWCESVTPKFAEKRAKSGGHSPGRLRVIGAVSNTNDFAQAFNCPRGSPMNPEKKCNIWQSSSTTDAVDRALIPQRRRRLGWIRNADRTK